jgi:hypothetical protein
MPVTKGLDYTGRIPGIVLRNQGYLHVFRYLGDPLAWPKALTRDEVNDLKSNGIAVYLNYEQTANFMLGGYSAGQIFGREARRWATSLGFSSDTPIIYSADFDVQDNEVSLVLDFLRGVANEDGGISVVGVYGGYKIVKAAIDLGYIGWQTGAWSYGQVDPRAIAWQGGLIYVNGVECDLNTMNSTYLQGSNTMTIPSSISSKWPNLAGDFPANAPFDASTALIWADAGARYTAYQADAIRADIAALSNRLDNLGATGSPNLTQADIEAIATAVVKKFAGDLAAG